MAFKSKYRGDQIEALLDRVNSGESGGTVLSNTFLVIGDYNSDARNNFAGVASGNKSADYYIGVVNVGGTKLQGVATIYSSEEGTSFSFIGYPSAGDYAHQMVKVTCTYNGSNFNTVLYPIMDYKQDVIEDLSSIRYGANLGATALQSIPSEYITESELTAKNYLTSIPAEYVTDSELLAKEYVTVSQLDKKANISDLSVVATSGNYNDLLNKPNIPDVSNKVDKVSGKGLSTEDFTTALKTKLESLSNYDDTEIEAAVSSLQTQLNTLVSGNANDAINSFNEIIAFLEGVKDTEDLSSIIASIEKQIAGKMDKVTLATVATSGDYNDLNNKPTIQKVLIIGDSSDETKANFRAFVNGTASADYYIGSVYVNGGIIFGIARPVIRSAVSGGGGEFEVTGYPDTGGSTGKFIKAKCECSSDGVITTTLKYVLDSKQDTIEDLATIREGAAKGAVAYEKPSTGIPKSDLAASVQSALVDAETFRGKYTKPDAGIPKSDLNSSVQKSLNKADSAVQTYIVNFDILQLLSGEDILADGGDDLRQAVEDHKLILIPLEKVSPAYGYLPMSVYAEDGIYFSVVYDTKVISGVVWDNEQELRVEDVIIEDVSQKQDKIKFETGGLSFITASGLNAENADVNVVLPSDANGEEDDILLTRNTVKTINGESIFGSGDIVISGGNSDANVAAVDTNDVIDDVNVDYATKTYVDGLVNDINSVLDNIIDGEVGGSGGEDDKYFTDFTVETVRRSAPTGITIQSNNIYTLIDAARTNKLICIPYTDVDSGYVVASYSFTDGDKYDLEANFNIFEGGSVYYFRLFYNGNGYDARGNGVVALSTHVDEIDVEDGVAYVNTMDNSVYIILDIVEELYVYPDMTLATGTTIKFISGENLTIEIPYCFWANGVVPTIEPNTHYELSISENLEGGYNAVLTSFKPVE